MNGCELLQDRDLYIPLSAHLGRNFSGFRSGLILGKRRSLESFQVAVTTIDIDRLAFSQYGRATSRPVVSLVTNTTHLRSK